MRRHKQEITDPEIIKGLLRKAQVMRLALARDNQPYVVPLSFGYDGTAVYFHCAKEGLKMNFLRANAVVCFEVEGEVAVRKHAEKPCDWGFTYQSVIGFGRAEELTAPEDMRAALSCIMRQYSDKDWEFSDASLRPVSVWKINIDELTGKQL